MGSPLTTSHPVYRRFLQTRTGVQTTFMVITLFFTQGIEIGFSILKLCSIKDCFIDKK